MTTTQLSPQSTLCSDNKFILFTTDWLRMQTYISAGMQLPIASGDFVTKYGSFPTLSQSEIEGCVSAMKDVNSLSASFGDPESIRKKVGEDPNYLGSTTPPDPIYGHMIWLASQIQDQASTFAFTFESLKPLFCGTKEQNAENLKLLLTGPGGLASTAQTANESTGTLMRRLGSFNSQFEDANRRLKDYTSSDSKILDAANKEVGTLQNSITSTQDSADKAYKEWEAFTIAAISSSVGVMVLSGGLLWPVAAALGGGLGAAAGIARSNYNSLCNDIAAFENQKKQKAQLVTDLTGLNSMLLKVAPAMQSFSTSLEEIQGVWLNINNNLLHIVNNYSVEELGNLSWVMQTMSILNAQKKWEAISQSTKLFVEGSMVSFQSGSFGTQIAA